MKTECRAIKVGHQVGEGVKAPKDVDALFSVVSPERTFYLVADSATEARLAFEPYFVSCNEKFKLVLVVSVRHMNMFVFVVQFVYKMHLCIGNIAIAFVL